MSEPVVADGEAQIAAPSPPIPVALSSWITSCLTIESGQPYTFKDRDYLRQAADCADQKILLKAARQVEKSCLSQSRILMADGSWKRAGDIVVGDVVATYDETTNRLVTGPVTWVSRIYTKRSRRITTALGHVTTLGYTHPVRMFRRWEIADNLQAGDRIASVRKAGEFGSLTVQSCRIRLTAFLIGDGYIGPYISFTQTPGVTLDDFMDALAKSGATAKISPPSRSAAADVRLHVGPVHAWMREDGLWMSRSATKFIPNWVFGLSRADTALFLNRLWSTDGHVKKNGRSKYSVEYASMSERLVRDVQSLLWKFGIPSSVRRSWPAIYKRRGEGKFAWILRIVTADGVRIFLTDIGALGKSEGVPLPDAGENNNRDTLPIEVGGLIREIRDSAAVRVGRSCADTLHSEGLRLSPAYPLTYDKAALYLSFFKGDPEFDPLKVAQLETALSRDVYWDRIAAVEEAGDQQCVDFTVEGTHSFICDGIVTHNSTFMCGRLVAMSCLMPRWKALYVSPSYSQTKLFSRVRLTPMLDSPHVRAKYFDPVTCVNHVLEKRLHNGSRIHMTFANQNADRARGISAHMILGDEVQDIRTDVFSILEETASHSPWGLQIYAGTPKTLNNTLEQFWKRSTQCEWMVNCGGCGARVLQDIRIIKKEGPCCPDCGRGLNMADGQWVMFGKMDAEFTGFRLPHTMVPWMWQLPHKWADIVRKMEKLPPQIFFNEVLGQAHEKGSNPITESMMKSVCDDGEHILGTRPTKYYPMLFGGIDWGTGRKSYTVASVCGRHEGKTRFIYFKKYVAEKDDPLFQARDIATTFARMGVKLVAADFGGGFAQNAELQRLLANFADLIQVQASGVKKLALEQGTGGLYTFNRSRAGYGLINMIKNRVAVFPRWSEFQEFQEDFTSIYEEYNDTMKQYVLDHPDDIPDDSFWAAAHAWLALKVGHGERDLS